MLTRSFLMIQKEILVIDGVPSTMVVKEDNA
jgi:hypothetical protein